jgi:hypothetical protein
MDIPQSKRIKIQCVKCGQWFYNLMQFNHHNCSAETNTKEVKQKSKWQT